MLANHVFCDIDAYKLVINVNEWRRYRKNIYIYTLGLNVRKIYFIFISLFNESNPAVVFQISLITILFISPFEIINVINIILPQIIKI